MIRKRGSLILCGTFLFITWNAILVLMLWGRPPPPPGQPGEPGREQREVAERPTNDVVGDVLRMADAFEAELELQKNILLQIKNQQALWEPANRNGAAPAGAQPVIPILVIACNRVTVRRCLDKLLELRPSAELFPIVVSQDCGHADTAEVIRSYGSRVIHLKQPDLADVAVRPEHKKFQGYYKISRHYRWALNQVAPDFFEYFQALLPLLKSDPSLWCVKQGQLKGTGPFRLEYSRKDSFKVMAKNLGVMEDLKSGVPRTGYRGVVSFISRGRRIYLAPPPGWTQYDPTWS
ncbi:Alpha-1,3-mannosyl-glycoprotein 2-beta-N-acetylglucosaminyltransferase [Liparis tanakae]|uniref:Alpha-1,3-mannosyl-glycoprotein 2-beta-N-acetylglucosaminyltransferase n=1 Tax=Liparis tanakae TaxID=230148 RepID=A0A4Z2FDT8_9TELE|nr:Alpha-1,3-mannosyl-glycoprotein 2-beta-N-acetylglucosaminyltransferase [Liparis tanakae]